MRLKKNYSSFGDPKKWSTWNQIISSFLKCVQCLFEYAIHIPDR